MTGNIIIKISENGIGIEADLQNVDFIDKCELLHAMTAGLGMCRREVEVYCVSEAAGVFHNAADYKAANTSAELDALVSGEEVSDDEG